MAYSESVKRVIALLWALLEIDVSKSSLPARAHLDNIKDGLTNIMSFGAYNADPLITALVDYSNERLSAKTARQIIIADSHIVRAIEQLDFRESIQPKGKG